MEKRYPFTQEQIERAKEVLRTIESAFIDMANSIQKAILSSEYFIKSAQKAKRREKYMRRYERIGRQKRKK